MYSIVVWKREIRSVFGGIPNVGVDVSGDVDVGPSEFDDDGFTLAN